LKRDRKDVGVECWKEHEESKIYTTFDFCLIKSVHLDHAMVLTKLSQNKPTLVKKKGTHTA